MTLQLAQPWRNYKVQETSMETTMSQFESELLALDELNPALEADVFREAEERLEQEDEDVTSLLFLLLTSINY